MKGFYISGGNGSVVQLEDGRWADTVLGDTSEQGDAHEVLDDLVGQPVDWQGQPLYGDLDLDQLEDYVGTDKK